MVRLLFLLSLSMLLLLAPADPLTAAPKPSLAPPTWELDFEYQDLQRMEIVLPGDSQPTTFWYLLYTVTNNSGREVEFYPSFELVTSSLEVVTGGDEISPRVNDAIAGRYRKLYPFFRDPMRVSGKLLEGPDNSRTSAAVFRNFDPEANALTVFVSGLSGEIKSVPNPVYDPEKPESVENVRFFPLRKTMSIHYDLPGDVRTRSLAPAVRTGQDWVMR